MIPVSKSVKHISPLVSTIEKIGLEQQSHNDFSQDYSHRKTQKTDFVFSAGLLAFGFKLVVEVIIDLVLDITILGDCRHIIHLPPGVY
jgi:hypothetical protein